MSAFEHEERPRKKPRFFVEDSPILEQNDAPQPGQDNALAANGDDAEQHSRSNEQGNLNDDAAADPGDFDMELFAAVVGEQVSRETLKKLQELSSNDLQQGELVFERVPCGDIRSFLI
jgi:hypothetical protein